MSRKTMNILMATCLAAALGFGIWAWYDCAQSDTSEEATERTVEEIRNHEDYANIIAGPPDLRFDDDGDGFCEAEPCMGSADQSRSVDSLRGGDLDDGSMDASWGNRPPMPERPREEDD